MKSKLGVSLLVVATMLCPAFAFAADQSPVAVDETMVVAEDAKTGDVVRIMETRPLSKDKRWIISEIVGSKV